MREGKPELDQEWDNRSPGIVAIDGWIDWWMDGRRGDEGRDEWSPGWSSDSLAECL